MAPTSGDVLLFDAVKLEAINVAEAHRSPLSCIALNNEGTLLATASDKGTVIRVFSVPDARKIYQFRRGSMPSRIYSMSFNPTSTLLCVSSATETVHIFKLATPNPHNNNNSNKNADSALENHNTPHPTLSTSRSRSRSQSHSPNRSASPSASNPATPLDTDTSTDLPSSSSSSARKHNGTLLGMIRRTSQNVSTTFAASIGTYLPTAVAEMWEPARDFAWLKIPKASTANSAPLRSVVALSGSGPQVMVVTNEGNFYVFGIDLEKGGEGALLKQYSVLDASERLAASGMEE